MVLMPPNITYSCAKNEGFYHPDKGNREAFGASGDNGISYDWV